MSSLRRGFSYGFAAYVLWGCFPLYFKLLRPTDPVEILAHRIVWSALFVAVVLLLARRWRRVRARPPDPAQPPDQRRAATSPARRLRQALGLLAAAVLIATNWGMFIYGVTTDRVVEVSLGYFITPLVTVLLGVFVLRERLRRWQWLALATGAAAVVTLAIDYGRLPYVALVLAGSFGLYGLVKKTLGLPAVEGLFVEAGLLALPALGFLWWLAGQGTATVGTISATHTGLVLGLGALTAIPLLLFAGAANRIPLRTLGILQYIAPVLQFGLGVFLFREPMPPGRLAGFALVWLALLVFTVDAIRHARSRADRPARSRADGPARPGGPELLAPTASVAAVRP